jgi:hypothetical protein
VNGNAGTANRTVNITTHVTPAVTPSSGAVSYVRGAAAVVIDAVAPGKALLDSHLQAVELLRDRSHVRDYTIGEWTAAVERAGFALEAVTRRQVRMDFPTWIARMRTPKIQADAIRALQIQASEEVRSHFAIEPDGSFQLDVMMIRARAA